MPWESRIANEQARQRFIAALMIIALGVSIGLAMMLSHSRQRAMQVVLVEDAIGSFETLRPVGWLRQAVMDDQQSVSMVVFNEPTGMGQLILLELDYNQPVNIDVAFEEMLEMLFDTPQIQMQIRSYKKGPLAGMIGEVMWIGRGRRPERRMLALLSDDGLAYLCLSMRPSPRHTNYKETMRRIVDSVRSLPAEPSDEESLNE